MISLVDCGRAMTQLAGHYSRFEHVLSAALVLSDVAATSGDRVGLLAFDDQIRASVPPQRGDRALRALHRSLSGLEATLTEPDYLSAFRVLATSPATSGARRLFHRRRQRAVGEELHRVRRPLGAAASASRRGNSERSAVGGSEGRARTGATALYRSAAAEELVHEREEALARMRSAGLVVLDVAPARMAAAVVNRYLEIKARGQL